MTHLNLSANDLDDDSVTSLALLPLQRLDVAKSRITRFDPARFPSLESLNVSGNSMGPKGLMVGESLLRLYLSGCGIGANANLKTLDTRLREVDLSFNDLGNCTSLPEWNDIRSLSLRGNRLTRLPERIWPSLRRLDLGVNFLTDGIHLNPKLCPSLTMLDLANVQLTDRGLCALLESGIVAGLTSLNLSWNRISDTGVKMLAGNPAVSQLRTLDLSGTHFGIAGAKALLDSPHLSNLRFLKIYNCEWLPAVWRNRLLVIGKPKSV